MVDNTVTGDCMNKFYEFFAGGGMVNAGLGDEWECLFANDFSEKKRAAYEANWGNDHFVPGDVGRVQLDQLPTQADLAWASFPCQDLSVAGNGAGLKGERSGTFWAFMKLIQQLREDRRKPRIITLENVYGAITSHAGKDFKAIIAALAAEGYRVGGMVIDAVHFVPQSRPRLFVVAVDEALQIPAALDGAQPTAAWHPRAITQAYGRLSKELRNRWVWWNLPTPQARRLTLEDIIEKEPQGVAWHSSDETWNLRRMMSEVNKKKLIDAQQAGRLRVGAVYRRMRNGQQRAEVRFDGVSGCLRTPSGGSSRQTIMVVNGEDVKSRLLSPREAALLMGLDHDYVLPEFYTDAYHLAGDGVAVPVVAHLARHIFEPVLAQNQLQLTELQQDLAEAA
jgi:DNA (cytosine-5)-methyltransferase 1